MRLFHISTTPALTVLSPSIPADDIINGVFVRGGIDVDTLPPETTCVSFSGNFVVNLKHMPSPGIVGYVYEPIYNMLVEQPRLAYLEMTPEVKEERGIWADYDETLEHRFYSPVPVRMVGEVHWEVGITMRVVWYEGNRQLIVRPFSGIVELKNDVEVPAVEELLPWATDAPVRDTPTGTCYSDAWRFLIKQGEGYLIHGSVQLSAEGARVNHAWAELPTGWVWEPQTKSYYTIEDFKMMSPVEEHRYTVEEAAIMVARTGNHGPWTDEERATHLRR